jgi:3-oxoacyl-[acyl-carrier-protein] synthase II
MEEALSDAQMSPSDIDYVNVNGTSTPLGDIAELKALDKIFGESIKELSISSTKSMTGHLLGAAAAIEALACIMAITRGVIPPTINVENLDEAVSPEFDLTLGVARHREVRAALSNTFGFGGHNSTVIFRKVHK